MYGRRLQDVRNRFHIPPGSSLPNLAAPQTVVSEISVSMCKPFMQFPFSALVPFLCACDLLTGRYFS